MLSVLAFLFVLSVLVVAHEFGHFIVAKILKVRVEIFSVGFGKKIAALRRGDTEYRLSLVPLGGYVKLAGDSPEEDRKGEPWEFLSRPAGQRAAIVFAGPLLNYAIAFVIFSVAFFSGVPALTTKIADVLEESPAENAGLQTHDRISAIDGTAVRYWDELSGIIQRRVDGKPLELTVMREGAARIISVVPRVERTKNIFGEDIKIGLIGITPAQEYEIVRCGFLESWRHGAGRVVKLTQVTFYGLYRMIAGKMPVRDSVTGPIGIFYITGEAAKMGFVSLLQIMGALSVSLAIINLFPFPVLDGGHLFFLFLEKLRGRPLSRRAQETAARIGISVLIALMAFVFYNDAVRFDIFEKIRTFFTGAG